MFALEKPCTGEIFFLLNFAQKGNLQGVRYDELLSVQDGGRHVGKCDGKHSSHIHKELWKLPTGPAFEEALQE